MITIWKFTISTFRLGILKLSSNVEIVKWLNMNRSTVWKFQEIGNTLDQPGHGRKRSIRSSKLLKKKKKHEGKVATKP